MQCPVTVDISHLSSFTADQDEYVGLWKDDDFTNGVLNEIFELEELAVGSSWGACEFLNFRLQPYLKLRIYIKLSLQRRYLLLHHLYLSQQRTPNSWTQPFSNIQLLKGRVKFCQRCYRWQNLVAETFNRKTAPLNNYVRLHVLLKLVSALSKFYYNHCLQHF